MRQNTCGNCGGSFPAVMVIGGKRRSLYKRKYCITCSPFGEHNTATLEDTTAGVCRYCERPFDYSRNQGHRRTICRACIMLKRRWRLKAKAVEYKGGKCQECGYDKCTSALDFHHKDPTLKEFSICNSFCKAWENIKPELDKCDLLCANCHRELHHTQDIDWSK